MRIVGLTGGIACGKSTVVRLVQQRAQPPIPVVDSDVIARQGERQMVKGEGKACVVAVGCECECGCDRAVL